MPSTNHHDTLANTTLIVIVGPTGVGKTDLCLQLAHEVGCSIVSCDSRQIYREMHIGTASPTEAQLAEIKHHFVASRSVYEHYNAGQYELDALPVIHQELLTHGTCILTGGSMLYADAISKGIDNIPTIPDEVRAEVQAYYQREGIEGIRRQLKLLDPIHYANSDIMNLKRMMHAIEVCIVAGKPFSSLRTGQVKTRDFKILKIGLERPREELYERINQRVLAMIDEGLEQEARRLLPMRHLNALDTVGYKEMFAYIDGEITLDEAIRLIQRNTRHYAKKQLTWFKHDTDTHWFHPLAVNEIIEFVKSSLNTKQ